MNNDEYRDSENDAKGFKVIDRRRFDEKGEEREHGIRDDTLTRETLARDYKGDSSARTGASRDQGQPQQLAASERARQTPDPIAPESISSSSEGAANSSSLNQPKEQPPFDFSVFIMSLADQAMWQLGVNPPPEGINIPADPVAAKQTIDIISMIEIKTRGNRDAMEERLVKAVLHELRMAYLKTSR